MKGIIQQLAAEDRLTQLLFVVVLLLGLVVVRREFLPHLFRNEGPTPSAHLLTGWEAARDIGLRVGPENADVQIVEFVDIECPACRAMHEVLEDLLERHQGRVSLTLVHFPLPYHDNAIPGGLALECAADQSVTAEMASVLFAEQSGLGTRPWLYYAERAGVSDSERFASCLADPARRAAVDEGLRVGSELGVGYTPTLLINGWVFEYTPNARLLQRTVSGLLRGIPPGPREAVVSKIPRQSEVEVLSVTATDLLGAPSWGLASRADWTVSDAVISAIGIEGGPPPSVLLPSNRLAILSPYDATLVIVDTNGKVERVIGGYGEGPSQFGVINDLAAIGGDSLVLLDPRNARIATVDVAAGAVTTVPLPEGVPSGHISIAGAIPNRGYLIHGFGRMRVVGAGASTRPLAPWGVVGHDRTWTPWQELADIQTQMLETHYGGTRGLEPAEVYWGPRTIATVAGDVVHTVETEEATVVTRNAEGRVIRRVDLELPRRLVTRQMRDAVIATRLEQLDLLVEPVFDVQESRRVIRAMPFADTLRGIDRMMVSPDKTMWVVPVVASGDSIWRAVGLRPDGTLAGTVSGPGALVPVAIGNGTVLGVMEERDGSRTLGRWRMIPR